MIATDRNHHHSRYDSPYHSISRYDMNHFYHITLISIIQLFNDNG